MGGGGGGGEEETRGRGNEWGKEGCMSVSREILYGYFRSLLPLLEQNECPLLMVNIQVAY